MDAVKFVEVYNRMCRKNDGCVNCPMRRTPLCLRREEKFSHEESERIVKIAEDWNKENPEELGKKYIIEICEAGKDFHYKYRIKGTNIFLSESGLADIKKYNESEE